MLEKSELAPKAEPVKEETVIPQVDIPETSVEEGLSTEEYLKLKEQEFKKNQFHYRPAFWDISIDEENDGFINARNTVTGLDFNGTHEEFNFLLRGR